MILDFIGAVKFSCLRLVQDATMLLYCSYKAFVLTLQSLCTDSTKPLYNLYKAYVLNQYCTDNISKGAFPHIG